MDFKFYLSLFWRRFPYFAFFFVGASAIGLSMAFLLPPTYRAEAVLAVQGQQFDTELAESTVNIEAREQLQIIQQQIISRDNLIDLARTQGIYDDREAAGERISAEEKVEDMRERILIWTPQFQQRGDATFVRVSFESPDPTMSAIVTNALVTQILNLNADLRRSTARQTLQFFDDQVRTLGDELDRKAAEILAFQETNLDALPDSIEFRRSQLAANQERLLQLEREESILVERRAQLIQIFETTGRLGADAAPQRPQTPEARQLQRLEDELAGLLATLSPTHPRVRQLEGQIAALAPRVEAQNDEAQPVDENGTRLTAFEIQLADIDTQIRFIEEEQNRLSFDMEELQANIARTPENAIRLATMERDYNNIQSQYNEAVASRAQAQTGEIIESEARGGRITIIENAVSPSEPESPNRPLVAAAGVGGGLFLGLGFIVLLELLNTSIRRPVDLTKKLGITPLGAIPRIRTRGEIFRRRAILVCAFATVLLAVPIGLWAVDTYVTPLGRLVDQVMARIG